MSIHYTAETFALTKAAKKVMPVETKVGRSFDLPVRLHVATVALYLAFLAVMALTYQTREMIIPMAIFVIYIAMAFGVPAMWVRMKPDHPVKTLGWAGFSRNGINTFTGVMRRTRCDRPGADAPCAHPRMGRRHRDNYCGCSLTATLGNQPVESGRVADFNSARAFPFYQPLLFKPRNLAADGFDGEAEQPRHVATGER